MSNSDGESTDGRLPPLRAWWVPWLAALIVAALVIGVGSYFVYVCDDEVASMEMSDSVVPPVVGLHDGEEILFVHTEASDPQVAGMLSDMMDSPVLVVPELANVPSSALGRVFVFTNGIRPDEARGPFGFQPDVFDSIPGDDDYSPLRAVQLVTWNDDSGARELLAVEDIEQARADGEITIDAPGIVVNMPVVQWPGGER